MPIKGISEVRRLRRLGRVRLGKKALSAKTGREYPTALDHFNFEDAPELGKLFGDNCRELEVMLPNERVDAFFPQERKAYRLSGLFCRGDGEVATRVNVGISDGEKNSPKVPKGQPLDPEGAKYLKEKKLAVNVGDMFELPCLGEDCPFTLQKFCKPIARFLFLIPKAPRVGCYEISTTSFNSIVELNSSIDTIRGIAGRISMIPLQLRLVPKETQVEGKKKTIHHLVLEYHGTFADLAKYHAAKEIALDQLPSRAELDAEVPDDLAPQGGAALGEHLGEAEVMHPAEVVDEGESVFDPPEEARQPAPAAKPAPKKETPPTSLPPRGLFR